jgi:tetratricopeptide (TPR) repeat protein
MRFEAIHIEGGPVTSHSKCLGGTHAQLLRRSATWLILLSVLVAATGQAQQPSLLDQARTAIDANHYATAEQLCRQALVNNPQSVGALSTLGLSLHMQGRSSDAIRYYSMALDLGYVPEIYAMLAAEKCRLLDFDGVRPMMKKLYRQERKNFRVISVVASCYLEIDQPVESTVVYQELMNDKDYPEDLALVMLTKSYIQSKQFFDGELNKVPGSEPYLAALRQAPSAGSNAARSEFARAARSSPYFSADLTWPEAVERWRLHPHDAALLYLLSVLSAEQGINQIDVCGERFPNSPYLQQFLADVLADQGHEDEAIEQYEQLIRDHHDLPDLQYSLGKLREKREEWDEASSAFRKQLTAYPTDERAAEHLSWCMLQAKQYAEVQTFLEPKVHSEHPPEWASLNLADAEQKLGHGAAAIQVLVAAEHQPGADKLVHYRLMRLYALAGRSADAKREEALFHAGSPQ